MGSENNMVAEFKRLHEAARGHEFDLTPTDGPIAQLTLFVHENGDRILARLAQPDAQQGVPGLDVDGICNDHGVWDCKECTAGLNPQQGASSPALGEGVEPCDLCHGNGRDRSNQLWPDHALCRVCDGTGRTTPLAAATQPAGAGEVKALLESIARPFPAKCNWEDQARACQIVAQQALAALTGAGENGEQGA